MARFHVDISQKNIYKSVIVIFKEKTEIRKIQKIKSVSKHNFFIEQT